MKNKTIALYAVIIVITAFLRLYQLGSNPPGFYVDEAAIGYNAYTLGKKGTDEYGIRYPVFFRSFGDYRLPIPIYAVVPSIRIFGLTEFGTRFPMALFGVISVIFMMLTAQKIAGQKTALLTGLFLAISPWHIHLSRWGAEYIYYLAFLSAALYFWMQSLQKPKYMVAAVVCFVLTFYTYYSALIITPILLLFVAVVYVNRGYLQKYTSLVILSVAVVILLCLPLVQGYRNGQVLSRWTNLQEQNPTRESRFDIFVTTYVEHFLPDFLFVKGDSGLKGHFVRHSVPGIGEMYAHDLPFTLIGLIVIGYRWYKNNKTGVDFTGMTMMLLLVILYPIGSSILTSGPYVFRSEIGVLPLTFFSAYGLSSLLQIIRVIPNQFSRRVLPVGIGLIIAVSFVYFSYLQFYRYPMVAAGYDGWFYGYRQVVEYARLHSREYESIYLFGIPHIDSIYFKFYDPTHTCKNCYTGAPAKFQPNKKILIAVREAEVLPSMQQIMNIKKIIYFPNGKPGFYLAELELSEEATPVIKVE